MAALCGMLAGLAAMAASGFSLVALWIFVVPHAGPAGAALVVAGVLAVLCLVLLALARNIVWRGRRQPRFEADTEASLLSATELLRKHKKVMFLAAMVSGLEAGAGSCGGNR